MKTSNQNKPSHLSSKIKPVFPWLGWVGFTVCIALFCITGCSQNTTMNEQAMTYQQATSAASSQAAELSHADAKVALDRFGKFLQGIGSEDFIKREITNVYAENAYLNDTLKTLTNLEKIKQHFIKTAQTMTSYSLEIDDISKSTKGDGYYIRWTMKFSAPKLASGKEIVSIGMSHVVFDKDGKALLHQDFWDSTTGMFEHVPIIGGGIRIIKKRL